jgi:hypothetical protein
MVYRITVHQMKTATRQLAKSHIKKELMRQILNYCDSGIICDADEQKCDTRVAIETRKSGSSCSNK